MAQTPLGPWPSRSPLWSQGPLITDRDWSKWLSRLRDDLNAATTLLDSDVALKSAPNAFTAGNSFAGIIDLLSGQLHFPATQNPSTNVNTLDDYEEGTFTMIDASGAGLVLTNVITAQYLKVGQLVFATGGVQYPVTASGLAAQIGGLPFVSSPGGAQYAAPVLFSTVGVGLMGLLGQNATAVQYFNELTAAQITNAGLSAKGLRFTTVYRAAA